jgi:hypothetical protein
MVIKQTKSVPVVVAAVPISIALHRIREHPFENEASEVIENHDRVAQPELMQRPVITKKRTRKEAFGDT